jgi:hypothetical protein
MHIFQLHTFGGLVLFDPAGSAPAREGVPRRPALTRRYLSTYLGAEGRLAVLTGDTAGASRAYQHYRLMADPRSSASWRLERLRCPEFAVMSV